MYRRRPRGADSGRALLLRLSLVYIRKDSLIPRPSRPNIPIAQPCQHYPHPSGLDHPLKAVVAILTLGAGATISVMVGAHPLDGLGLAGKHASSRVAAQQARVRLRQRAVHFSSAQVVGSYGLEWQAFFAQHNLDLLRVGR
jgi:hypothetical protein